MAGAKETPRQKMIGIMYLVLLALLALQVSSSIIKKFQDINASIEESVGIAKIHNLETLQQITETVAAAKNNKKDLAVLNDAKTIREQTKELVSYIEKNKQFLIKKTGGLQEDGNLVGAKEEEPVAQYMLGSGDSKNGEAYKLKLKLNDYVASMEAIYNKYKAKKSLVKLARDAKQDPRYKDDPEQKNKDFAVLNFESTPLAAAITILSEKQNAVLNIESEALNFMKEQLSTEIINVDKIRPVVKSTSKYVVAGREYEAEMFMAAYSSKIQPRMTYNGGDLEVSPQGSGSIKFKASSGAYDENGLAKKTWKGTIKYPKADGTDSIYEIEQEYYVVKPVIQVQSLSVQSLYRNCGNKLSIQVPALGSEYRPTFRATGAQVITGSKPGDVMLVPTSPNVELSVYNDGALIGKRNFRVGLVPKPELSINLSERRGVHPGKITSLKIFAKSDEGFKKLNPNEATFYPTKYKAYLVRNGKVRKVQEIKGSTGSGLSAIKNEARDGDVLTIEVLEVKRRNFRKRLETVNMGAKIFKVFIRE